MAASPAAVGCATTSAGLTDRPRAAASSRASRTAWSELPPSSKKLASTLIASAATPSTAANAARAAVSSGVRGPTIADASAGCTSAAGSRRRSILPLLERGHASMPTTTDGTM